MASLLTYFRRKLVPTASNVGTRSLSCLTRPAVSPELTTRDPRFLLHSSSEPRPIDHSTFLRFPEVHVSTLPNGIRVVTQAYPSSALHTASVGVWVDAGSRFEALGTNGTAHFLEHMIFKGTHRRTASSLEIEIEDIGGRLNAYTTREQTTFFADVQSKDIPAAMDVLADILQYSQFPNHAIKNERGVILREMQEVQGQMEEVIFDHLHEAAYLGHSLGNTILGPKENIQAITRNDLLNYITTHYTGHRMVVSAAGAVQHDDIVYMATRLFKDFSTDPTTVRQLLQANPAVFTGSEVRVENEEIPLAHLAVAFEGTACEDPISIPLMVIQCLLGSWNRSGSVGNCPGSELARRVSKGNLAESIMAFNTNYGDTGLFGVYVSAMPDCLHSLSEVLMEEIRRLAYKVSEEEVIRAQNKLKSSLLLHIDGTTASAENNGRQLLTYGRPIPFLELFARIEAVDAATVMETIKNFIIDKDIAVAAVGQLNNLPDYNWFRSQALLA